MSQNSFADVWEIKNQEKDRVGKEGRRRGGKGKRQRKKGKGKQ
jgi:hypothetical protein